MVAKKIGIPKKKVLFGIRQNFRESSGIPTMVGNKVVITFFNHSDKPVDKKLLIPSYPKDADVIYQ